MDNTNLIMYTDGSANPNPGLIGSASHGYVYENYSEKKFELFENVLTDKGYLKEIELKESDAKLVEPLYFIEKNCSFSHDASNNYAEVFALKQILDWIKDSNVKFKSILIYTDSMYVVNKINSIKEGKLSDSSNKEIWDEVSKLYINIENITIEWVKGHNGHLGNVIADFSASIARNNSHKGIYGCKEKVISAKEIFSDKIDIHPLLCFNNLVINNKSMPTNQSPTLYYMYNTDLPDNLIGKANAKSNYAIVCLDEPVNVIEEIKTRQIEARFYNAIMLLKLNKVKTKKYYPRLNTCAFNSLNNKGFTNTLVFIDNEVITQEINPPGLLMRALEHYDFLTDILININNNSDSIIVIDVTHYFYESQEIKKKIKTKLKDSFVVGFKDLDVSIKLNDKNVNVPLVLGEDMPNRNVLKSIENTNPKISLVLWNRSEKSYGYSIYIKSNDSYSIWSNMSTNRVIMT